MLDPVAIFVEALRIRTDSAAYLPQWHRYLELSFPIVHRELTVEKFDDYGRLYRWEGADPRVAPLLLTAHYDVVPAEESRWTVPPWAGEIRDGYVYGRGAIDDKLSHITMLVAAERLLHRGWRPRRSIYFAFGGDEETGGIRGAAHISSVLADRGVHFALALDEGAAVVRGMVAGLTTPVGLIGCGEKGTLDVLIRVSTTPGHAATPPRPRPRKIIARILRRIPAFAVKPPRTTTTFIRALGSILSGVPGTLLRLYPITKPIVHLFLSRAASTDAMLRSTAALTMIRGSQAPNVLPPMYEFVLNMRLLPGVRIGDVIDDIRQRLRRFPAEVLVLPGSPANEAPTESPTDGPEYRAISRAINTAWPGIPILPYLVTSTTDSRHYAAVSDRVYRFAPYEIEPEDLKRIHGDDERVPIDAVDRAVSFYESFITDYAGGDR